MEAISPIFSYPARQQVLSVAGIQVVYKISSEHTNGEWSLLEYTAPPFYEGPATHYHKILEETFYVLEGTLSLLAGTEWVEATAGSTVIVPPLMVHKFANRTDQPVRFLLWMRPGGFEGYFEQVVQLRNNEPVWPPKDKTLLLELMERYDTFSPEL